MNESASASTGLSFPTGSDGSSGADAATTVHLFSEIEQGGTISQESIATKLGIAVGLTNAYIKKCVRKGYIKMQRVPARRYAYFLTPAGFAEKASLTAEYLSHSFSFFRRARSQCQEQLAYCARRGWNRVLLAGTGELAEVAVLSAMEIPEVRLTGILAPGKNIGHFAGLPVLSSAGGDFDAVLITDTARPHVTYENLRQQMNDDRILLVPLLHIVRKDCSAAER
ncbi:MAG: winged helix-turn-helix transcriptional regulator [Alphaproteobacteria bacterium]|nr:winged helix-turn-helix transcriptional regulator [Alphaproteobacteria bacterium]